MLRHDPDGVHRMMEKLTELGEASGRGEKMKKALKYFEKHSCRMDYHGVAEMKLPIGSGMVESAVRRVINLRFKAPGCFWKESTVQGLMHLRAWFKAGRWDELMKRVLTGQFHIPSFDTSPLTESSPPPDHTGTALPLLACADDHEDEDAEVTG